MVVAILDRRDQTPLHPFRAILLGGTVSLFLGALLSDWAYASSYELQWKNFASWLIVGGLVFGGFSLLWPLIDLFRTRRRAWPLFHFLLLLSAWGLGFVNALVHAMDAWASMPAALILSAIVALLVVATTGLGLFAARKEGMA